MNHPDVATRDDAAGRRRESDGASHPSRADPTVPCSILSTLYLSQTNAHRAHPLHKTGSRDDRTGRHRGQAQDRTPQARPLRGPAHRLHPPRQLLRRHQKLGQDAGRIRRVLLRRRPPRHHRGRTRPEGTRQVHALIRGHLPRRRARPSTLQRLRPVARLRALRAVLAPKLRHAHRLAREDDPVQGEGAQGWRGRQRRLTRLPRAHGERHLAVQRGHRARGGGPAAAPRAHPRHCGPR